MFSFLIQLSQTIKKCKNSAKEIAELQKEEQKEKLCALLKEWDIAFGTKRKLELGFES